MGMAEHPLQNHSLASRLVCNECGVTPEIVSVTGDGMYTIVVKCHGETDRKTVERKELVHIQRFFVHESDDGGDA
jgi:hypothetical protein